jgi:hypothetical protein
MIPLSQDGEPMVPLFLPGGRMDGLSLGAREQLSTETGYLLSRSAILLRTPAIFDLLGSQARYGPVSDNVAL